MIWNKQNILQALKQRFKAGDDLSYNALPRSQQSLVSAAAYHFGSYRAAVAKAGIDYANVTRRPHWNKGRIVATIKMATATNRICTGRRHQAARRTGQGGIRFTADAVVWPVGSRLEAAGLKVGDVSRYRQWDRKSIVEEIKNRARREKAINSGAMQKHDPGLHAAAVRYFGNYDSALKSAKIDPASIRRRKTWTPDEVLKSLKRLHRQGQPLSDTEVRRSHPALYGAAVRCWDRSPPPATRRA